MLGYNEGFDKGLPLVELFGPLSRVGIKGACGPPFGLLFGPPFGPFLAMASKALLDLLLVCFLVPLLVPFSR